MPQSNKTVLLGGTVIVAVGFAKAVTSGGSPTKVFAGGVGIVLLASLLELLGPRASQLATGLVGLATVTILLVEAPAVYAGIAHAQKAAPSSAVVAAPQQTPVQAAAYHAANAASHPITMTGGPQAA
jgi:hypothetical protein